MDQLRKAEDIFNLELEVQNMLPHTYPHNKIDGIKVFRAPYNEISYLMIRDRFMEELGQADLDEKNIAILRKKINVAKLVDLKAFLKN